MFSSENARLLRNFPLLCNWSYYRHIRFHAKYRQSKDRIVMKNYY